MHMGQRLLGPIGDRIGLTDEQKSRIQAILDESQPRLQELRDQLTAARDAFMADQDPTVFDEAAIRSFAASQSQIKTDLMVEVARARTEIHSVLTAEQQQQLDDLRGACGLCGRQGGGRGARGGRGAGAGNGNGTGTCPYGNS
jgi:Spy/CpxP family protein refolding chaperone